MIVVASNDNESSQVTILRFSICVIDGVVIIDCVAIFMKRAKEANIIARRISLDVGF